MIKRENREREKFQKIGEERDIARVRKMIGSKASFKPDKLTIYN